MSRDDEQRLIHMLVAARNIERVMTRATKQQFIDDYETREAIFYGLNVGCQAAYEITNETKQDTSLIPWDEIESMHNRLVGPVEAVDLGAVWDVLESDLSLLIDAVSQYVDAPDDDDDFNAGAPVPR